MTNTTLMSDAAVTSQGDASSTVVDTPATATPASAPVDTPTVDTTTQQQATDGQTQTDTKDGTAKGDDPAADKPAEPQGAPDKYEFSAPEGVQLDDKVIGQLSEVARELNMPQEAAQKLLDKMGPAIQAQQLDAVSKAAEAWAESAKTDKEFGGEKLTENLAIAKKALDQFGSPELNALLKDGLGNHPEIIRAFYRVGKAVSEDNFVPGRTSPNASRDPANSLYPNQQK